MLSIKCLLDLERLKADTKADTKIRKIRKRIKNRKRIKRRKNSEFRYLYKK